jgi:transposase InsO family protein
MKSERNACAVAFLEAAVAYYADNGFSYRSKAFRNACRHLRLRHIRTRPYTPKTNGKADRFIKTALREWAYARAYDTSQQRADQLPYWMHRYNWHRLHGTIGTRPPITTLGLTGNNLLRLHN